MWFRGVFTVVCSALAAVAFVVWDCATSVVGDPLGVCRTIEWFELSEPLWAVVGLAGTAVVGLAMVWIPYGRHRRREQKVQPERALVENIGRLPEPYREFQDDVSTESDPVARLRDRVEAIEYAFSSDTADERSLTSEWISLLVEANRMHNEGTLPTEVFQTLNTRLLEVVTAPAARSA